jgi:hypothetical protein
MKGSISESFHAPHPSVLLTACFYDLYSKVGPSNDRQVDSGDFLISRELRVRTSRETFFTFLVSYEPGKPKIEFSLTKMRSGLILFKKISKC